MLRIFIISATISGGIIGIIFKLLSLYYQSNAKLGGKLHQFRSLLANTIGDFSAFLILFVPLLCLVFFLLLKEYERSFHQITEGISEIANGNFDVILDVKNNDEIGNLASNVTIAAEKLKHAVQTGEFAKSSKDRLIVNVAHDLRTPLTSINGYLNLIVRKQELTDEQMKHYAQIAYSKSLRMERLIENLFEYTTYNYGEMQLKKEQIDIAHLIQQIMDEFYPSFIENQLEGRLFIKQNPAYIEADGDLIARVLDNIISNAVRYGKEGKYIDIELLQKEQTLTMRIINYDSMIPEDELENIFETFYRTEKSRTSVSGGSGLGLAIAKNIIELHHGTIIAESNFERTIFEIQLPVQH